MENTLKIGTKAGVNWGKLKVDPKQLKMGIKAEAEHKDLIGNNKVKQAKIALAHLKEMPDYYNHLEKMESGAKKSPKTVENRRKVIKGLIGQMK